MPPKANKKAKGKQTETPSAAPVVIEKPPAKSPKNGAAADFSDSDDEAAQGATPQGDLTEAIIVNPNEAATPAPVPAEARALVPVSSGKKRKVPETDLQKAAAEVSRLQKKLNATKARKEKITSDPNASRNKKSEKASENFKKVSEELKETAKGNAKITTFREKIIKYVEIIEPHLTPEYASKLGKFFKALGENLSSRNAVADKLLDEINTLKADLKSALDEKYKLEQAEYGLD